MNQVVDEHLFLDDFFGEHVGSCGWIVVDRGVPSVWRTSDIREAIGNCLSPQRTLSLRSWVYRQDHPKGLGGRMGMHVLFEAVGEESGCIGIGLDS